MNSRITIRMSDDMMARIDTWIAAQPSQFSRPEAVRFFVDRSLAGADGLVELDSSGGSGSNELRGKLQDSDLANPAAWPRRYL